MVALHLRALQLDLAWRWVTVPVLPAAHGCRGGGTVVVVALRRTAAERLTLLHLEDNLLSLAAPCIAVFDWQH